MPAYDYRCKGCEYQFTLTYKTYKDYDAAIRECPNCGSVELSRLIKRVAVQSPTRDFTRMSSNDMLSVMESGDSRQVGEMFKQVGGGNEGLGSQYHEATERLLKGESMDKVERDLSAGSGSSE